MAEVFILLLFAALLLLVAPQLAGWLVGLLSGDRPRPWTRIAAVVAAPLVFYLIATELYSPGSSSVLQAAKAEKGYIQVDNVETLTLAHAAVAAFVQLVRWIRYR